MVSYDVQNKGLQVEGPAYAKTCDRKEDGALRELRTGPVAKTGCAGEKHGTTQSW